LNVNKLIFEDNCTHIQRTSCNRKTNSLPMC